MSSRRIPTDPQLLLAHIDDRDARVRRDAVQALGLLGDLRAVTKIRVLLKDPVKDVRIEAALALIRLGEDGLYSNLLSALKHPTRQIVIGAALTLGRLGDRRATQHLVDAFKTNDQEIGAAVAWALGQCRDSFALPWLMAAVEHDFACAKACEALGNIGDEKAQGVLSRALESTCEDVRAYAARALSLLRFDKTEMAVPKVVFALERLLKDTSRKVRLCAALSLHKLRGMP
jgi:HEAT repeat protein